jgi:hypothetical protein
MNTDMACLICGNEPPRGESEDGICATCWDEIHGTVDHTIIEL